MCSSHQYLNYTLIQACEKGNLSEVIKAIEQGANPSYSNEYPLQKASLHGHLSIVQYLLSHNVNINEKEGMAFRWASRHGHREIIFFFLSLPQYQHTLKNSKLLLRDCLENNYTTLLKSYLIYEKTQQIRLEPFYYLDLFIQYGRKDLIAWCYQKGIKLKPHLHQLMIRSCALGQTNIIRYLMNIGYTKFKFFKIQYFIEALTHQEYHTMDFFLNHGFDISPHINIILKKCIIQDNDILLQVFLNNLVHSQDLNEKTIVCLLKYIVINNDIDHMKLLLHHHICIHGYSHIALLTVLKESNEDEYSDYSLMLSFILEQYKTHDWTELMSLENTILYYKKKKTNHLRQWCFKYIQTQYQYYYLNDIMLKKTEHIPLHKI